MADSVCEMFINTLYFTTFIKVCQDKSHMEASFFIEHYNNFDNLELN